MTPESHEVLLSSVDCLREMLLAKKIDAAIDEKKANNLQQRMRQLLGSPHNDTSSNAEVPAAAASSVERNWRIVFRPLPEIFMSGNDPLRILRELERLGDMRAVVDCSGLPRFDELDVHKCYLSWVIELSGDVARGAIEELFEWVMDECELEIEQLAIQDQPGVISHTTSPREQREPAAAKSTRATKGKDSGSIRVSIEKTDCSS